MPVASRWCLRRALRVTTLARDRQVARAAVRGTTRVGLLGVAPRALRASTKEVRGEALAQLAFRARSNRRPANLSASVV